MRTFLCAISIFGDQILQLLHKMTMTCYVCKRTLVLLIEQILLLFTQACSSYFPVIPHQSLPEQFLVLVQLPHYLWLQLQLQNICVSCVWYWRPGWEGGGGRGGVGEPEKERLEIDIIANHLT